MKLARISTPLFAVPMALLAVTALPEQAQAQCNSGYGYDGYAVPGYSYAPAPQVYYHTSEAYYPPPPVVHYVPPRRSLSFGISIGGGHHGHHVRHGHRSHHRISHHGHSRHRSHGGGFGFHIGGF